MNVSALKRRATLAAVCAVSLMAWHFCIGSPVTAAEEEIPSLQDLVQPVGEETAEGEAEEAKPKFPPRLSIEEANREGQYLLAPGPLCFFDVPNAQGFGANLKEAAFMQLMDEKKVEMFFKSNDFGPGQLFTDLPPAYSSSESIELLAAARRLADPFFDNNRRLLFAVYRIEGEGLVSVLLADIGRDRQEPHDKIIAVRDEFLDETPNFVLDESEHGGDYIDVIRNDAGGAELAYGIVRNFAVVATSAAEAKRILKAGAEGRGDEDLSRSVAYADMGTYTDGESQLKGFVDLTGIRTVAEQNALPTATEMLGLTTDVVGHGGAGGSGPQLMYYDIRAENGKVIENVVSPARTPAGVEPGIPARLADMLKTPAELGADGPDWITPRLIPYQPDVVLMAQVKPGKFSEFLAIDDEKRFGSSPYAQELSKSVPETLKRLVLQVLQNNLDTVLGGEVTFALLPARQEKRHWLVAMSVSSVSVAETSFATFQPVSDINGVKIRSMDPGNWNDSPCWAVFDQTVFTHIKTIFGNVGQSCMVIASNGELLQDTIDQVTALSSLADNKDFIAQARAAGKDAGMVVYLNLPGMIGREYVNIPSELKSYYPRMKGVSNLPPMSLANKYAFGFGIGVTAKPGEAHCRSTITGPMPLMPALAATLTLKFPRWVRERSRQQQRTSRENLGRIWLELQTYATQRGHFPESYEVLRSLFPEEKRDRIFTSDAAIDYLGEEAAQRSYDYLPGLRATDAPDLPVVWEQQPWHWEYSGMFPEGDNRPTESGAYQRYRLVLRLDGTITAYSEEQFRKYVLPRLRARQ